MSQQEQSDEYMAYLEGQLHKTQTGCCKNCGASILPPHCCTCEGCDGCQQGTCRWTWTPEENSGFWEAECQRDYDRPIALLHEGAKYCTFCGGELVMEDE